MIDQCSKPAAAIIATERRETRAQHPAALPRSRRTARHWSHGLPQLDGARVHLREFRVSDSEAMWVAMSRPGPSRFNYPAPATVEGFEQFITWTHRQRSAREQASFAMIPRGSGMAVGIIQFRALRPDFSAAEWGFALGCEYHGTGMFNNGARLAIDFAFGVMGVLRLEAKAVVENVSANAALRRLGAVQERVLRQSFFSAGQSFDQAVWAIHASGWRPGA